MFQNPKRNPKHHWTAAWTASPQPPSTGFTPNWSQEGFSGHTVRQVVRVTAAGDRVRIRLSNAYGTSPLHVTGATVALTDTGAAVRPGTPHHLTFGGDRSVAVPARAHVESDAAPLAPHRLDRLTVTLHLAGTTGPATFHAQGFTDTHRAGGDHLDDVTGAPFTEVTSSWYYLTGVDVSTAAGGTPASAPGVVLFGDSLTDGFGSTPNADRRWSDALAERVERPVLNAGIGGNLLLNDSAWYGERSSARFHRDALGLPGAGTVVLLQGLNDIGFSEARDQATYKPAPVLSSADLVAGYRTLIRAAHDRGVRIVGATILPFKGTTHWGPRAAKVSAEVNDWMRGSGEFDAVADLHRIMADPADPDLLNPAYAYEDGLHPDDAGYRVMAEAVAPLL
ncbi:SGNH/GDSL hydrolase family protein [Streptomyces ficellus]|uniref:SGNH/GDSL hydrolase family protein n=1 Tax=Streptomyces ficellus TaxID=1977088 RepID=A0A6I6FIG7_9ACTN|nr:SGNH/GDSL hydrolase family protein [Streptomyces ficellus]QGV78875.1 SGNH/GDSL hydrolase family protein [Streptomyces ficellus]